jgi:oligosaccharide 4-alpha-D-glucosyltransferase
MKKLFFQSPMRFLVAVVCLIVFQPIFAQNPNQTSLQFTQTEGAWTIEQWAPNIIKLSFQPTGYTHNEAITGGALGKALSKVEKTLIAQNGNQILIGKNKEVALSYLQDQEGNKGFQIGLATDEKIFGGGERALPLNRRGYKFNLYNNPWYGYAEGADNLNFSVPFFSSSKGYALFFDNGSKGYADIGKTNPNFFQTGFNSGALSVFVILGNYQQTLTSYQQLTGKQPLPPKWALGNFMSRFGYTSDTQVRSIAAKMRQEKIPFDAVIFDLFWFGDSIKGTMGNLDWVNKSKWPNPKQLLQDLKKTNTHPILISEPFILKGTKSYPFAQPYLAKDSLGKAYELQDFYFGKGGLIDIFRKDAGDWLWKYHYQQQIANGVDGWWTDLGEPEKHPADLLHNLKDLGVNRMMKADEVHNLYGHYWNKMLFEKYATAFPNTRLFHLNRSGFSGSQRYSIFPWTGDVHRNWSGLRAQLPNILGTSMSGIPYIHSDAGGFAMGEGDPELYLRWLQFALYTPIFRPHGTALYEVDPNAFSYPSEPALADASVLDQVKSVVAQRYQMLPYNYTLAYRQAAFGEPLIKPLYYVYPDDATAVNIGDEFLWGDAFLVAPVLEKGMSKRDVYLPKGNWYALASNQRFEGNTTISQDLSNFAFPVFVKAGSFIPMNKGLQANTTETKKTVFEIQYYPSEQPSQYQLYLDDGVSKNAIAVKQFELINFNSKGMNQQNGEISIHTNGGQYPGKPSQLAFQLVIPNVKKLPTAIQINGQSISLLDASNTLGISTGEQAIWNLGKKQELRIPLVLAGKDLNLKLVF